MNIRRPRLLAALDAAYDQPLTVVNGGPGSGKTVLVSDWARSRPTPIPWLALSEVDNHPRRFWSLLRTAVAACMDTGPAPLPAQRVAGGAFDPETLLDFTCAEPVVVVLDDAHTVTDPEILAGLDRLLHRSAGRLHLVLAVRHASHLPLHRYRLGGLVQEIGAHDLAMTRQEAAELIAALGRSATDEDVALLHEHTEGWVAGLCLSGIPAQPGAVRTLTADPPGPSGSAGDYLMREAFEALSDEARSLLIGTSFLPEFSGSLAQTVTGIEHAPAILRQLAESNSFLETTGRSGVTYRCHPQLRQLLETFAGERPREWHRTAMLRAASWYEVHSEFFDALSWSVRAHDAAQVTALLEGGGLAAAFVRQQLPPAFDAGHPAPTGPDGLSAGRGSVHRWAVAALRADRTMPDVDLADIENARRQDGGLSPDAAATLDVAELIMSQRAGLHAGIDRLAQRLLDADGVSWVDVVPGFHARVLLAQARSRFEVGRFDAADRVLDTLLSRETTPETPPMIMDAYALRAMLHGHAGRMSRAQLSIERAEQVARDHPDITRRPALDLAVAQRELLRGEFDSARQAATLVCTVCSPTFETDLIAGATLVLAAGSLALGQVRAARDVLQGCPPLLARTTGLQAVARDGILADIHLLLGRPTAALTLMLAYKGTDFEAATAPVVARSHLALDDPASARACIRRVMTADSSQVPLSLLVDVMLCEAVTAAVTGDDAAALMSVEHAFELAAGGLRLPFIAQTAALAPVLTRHPSVGARWPVSPAASLPSPRTDPPLDLGATDLADGVLTDRERVVLRLLPTTMPAAEIADALCLSLNTIKSHQASIYRKLAARNRREAVARARALELL